MNDDALRERLKRLDDRVKDGTVLHATEEELTADLHALCEQRAACIFTAREVNKGFLVASLLMEKRNERTNNLIIALAVIGVAVGIAQILLGIISLCTASR